MHMGASICVHGWRIKNTCVRIKDRVSAVSLCSADWGLQLCDSNLPVFFRALGTGWVTWGFCASISVQFSRSVMSDSLWHHELQHARPPCPSPTSGVHSNSCPSSRWCHPAISSSVVPFSFCPQSLPASGSFPMSQLFPWGGQSTGVSALASVLPMNTQDWSPLPICIMGTEEPASGVYCENV